MNSSGNSYIYARFNSFFTNCCGGVSCWLCCRKCTFCWRGLCYRDEFLLENFYEEISPQEWNMIEKEARKVKGNPGEKIVLVETNVLPSFQEHVAAASEQEITKPSRTLVDYRASDFINDEESREVKSSRERLNTKKNRSYTEPDFMTEMWKNPSKTKPLNVIFRKRKYSRFMNELDKEDSSGEEFPQVKSKLNLRTKILARRSQRQGRHELEVAENATRSLSPSSMFNDCHGQIEASFSFAAHVRRQGPGFSASCTQTLRTSDFSISDLFESEVHSNVTFNPLFEDDDGEDEDEDEVYVKQARPRRYRLYTIDEESEHYDSGF